MFSRKEISMKRATTLLGLILLLALTGTVASAPAGSGAPTRPRS